MIRYPAIAIGLIAVQSICTGSALADGPSSTSRHSFYAGVNLGAGGAESDWFLPFGAGGTDITLDGSSVLGGAQFGYRYAFENNIVAGWEVGVRATDVEAEGTVPAPAISCRTGVVNCRLTEIETLTTAELRIGYAVEDWLFSLTGGYAGASVGTDGVILATGATDYGDDVWHHGWTAGVSVELELADNWSGGLQYNHVELDTERHAQSFGAGNARDVDLTLDMVTVRLNYHFEL